MERELKWRYNSGVNTGASAPAELAADRPKANGLRFHLFGPLEITQNGKPLPRTRTRTEMWLLALLALRSNGEVQRSWLAGTFWPDSDEAQALNNLRRSLSNLRSVLGADGVRLVSPTRSTLTLDLTDAWCDIHAFDAAISRGDKRSLAEAIDLYRGPLIETCDEDWVCTERAVRERMYLEAMEALADHESAAGRHDRATELLRRVIAVDPGREPAQRRLLVALREFGDLPAMIHAYRAFRLYLHTELRSEPAPETTALFQRLRSAPKAPASLAMPQAVTPSVPRGNVPIALTRFYGRAPELDQLIHLLEEPNTRLVTLTGMGGSGKTRLALETGQRMQQATGMPVWFVPLADIHLSDLLFDAIRSALEIAPVPNSDTLSQIAVALQSEPTLLILDNFEQLIDAGAPLLRLLLDRIPRLKILLTSRQSLEITGEQELAVAPLPIPLRMGTPERLLEFASVQMFVNRAQARKADFQITRKNAATIARLCEKLEGLPLAIELAAPWIKLLTPEQMVAQLGHPLEFLISSYADLPPRHRTLRAVIESSYRLLEPGMQRFAACLSVFRGGWTLDAAAAVCTNEFCTPAPRPLDALAHLQARSLIVAEITDTEEMRYRMPEMLVAYATEQLAAEETRTGAGSGESARRHANYFLELAERAVVLLQSGEQAFWLKRIEQEADNFRAALAYFARLPERSASELRLAGALGKFWEIRGRYEEGITHLEAALARSSPGEAGNSEALLRVLIAVGNLLYRRSDYERAQARYVSAMEIARLAGRRQEEALILKLLGNIAYSQSRLMEAQELYGASLTLYRALNQPMAAAHLIDSLGNVAYALGDVARAVELHSEALPFMRQAGDLVSLAIALNNLGNAAQGLKRYDLAQSVLNESLEISRALGHSESIAFALRNLAYVATGREDWAAAAALFKESLLLFREMDAKQPLSEVLWGLAELSLELHDAMHAVRLAAAAQALSERLGVVPNADENIQVGQGEFLGRARTLLGVPIYTAVFEEGRLLTIEQACDLAVETMSTGVRSAKS